MNYLRQVCINRKSAGFVLFVLILILAACSRPVASTRVFFLEPKDGSSINSPVKIKMGAENFIVEPAGDVREGYGHLHIMVNSECLASGQVIPKDETHLHYGQGQLEAELELDPGTYRLCLQAADGAHMALDGDEMKQIVTVTVK